MPSIHRLLTGEIPPREAFWNWLVTRGLIVNLACTLAAMVLVATAPEDATWQLWSAAALHLAAIPFNVICLLGVWRGVNRHSSAEREATLLRAGAVALFLAYLVL